MSTAAGLRRNAEVFISAEASPAERRQYERLASSGRLQRIARGIYVRGESPEEAALVVRRNWQYILSALAPNAVVSHKSAMSRGISEDGVLYLSHPTIFNRRFDLPGLTVHMLKGPGPLPGDLQLSGNALYWAARPRYVLENLGRQAPRRVGNEGVEGHLIDVLNSSGETALNSLRDSALAIAPALGMESQLADLRKTISALLGTHARAALRTHDGQMVAQGTPIDGERLARLETLSAYLRATPVPLIKEVTDSPRARTHFAFIESYFSNYVEGTKFDVEEAERIALRNQIMVARPKDSHDILGVFNLALTTPFRDSPPPPGEPFLRGLQAWHGEMLAKRPEANPGLLKTQTNYAGSTRFVVPGQVRGTLIEGSRLAMTVPEGLARGIYYAFLVSEVHPFDDGNGRLSRLLMNAELSRTGASRIIIPTLFHPQYVDCAKVLTSSNEPEGFVRALSKMAAWCAGFEYEDLPQLISRLKECNAFEESPMRFKLLDHTGKADIDYGVITPEFAPRP